MDAPIPTHQVLVGSFDTYWSKPADSNFTYKLSWNDSSHDSTRDVSVVPAVLIGLILGCVTITTIVGNSLVLVAVFVNSHLRGTTHYFIANLAAADLLLGTTVLPFAASLEVLNSWLFGELFCNVWAAMDVLCCTASIMSLCVISIDRYIGVTRPLRHSSILTTRRAGFIIMFIWILSIVISVAPLFGWKEAAHEDSSVCEVTKQLGYVLFSVVGSFYIPLTIILLVYWRVYREARRQSIFLSTGVKTSKCNTGHTEVTLRVHTGRQLKKASCESTRHQNSQTRSNSDPEQHTNTRRRLQSRLTVAGKLAKFNREKKAAKTLAIVVGVFIICWLPFFFVLPLEALCSACITPEWLFKIIFWLGYCNSMMNPIIYACSSREFKRAYIRILRCRYRRRRPPVPLPRVLGNPSNPWSALNCSFNKVKGIALKSQARQNARHKTKRCAMNDVDNSTPMLSMKMYSFNEHESVFSASTVADDDSPDHVMPEETTSGMWSSPQKLGATTTGGESNNQHAWTDYSPSSLSNGIDQSASLCHADHSRSSCHGNPTGQHNSVNSRVQTADMSVTSLAFCVDNCAPRLNKAPFLGPPRRTIFITPRR